MTKAITITSKHTPKHDTVDDILLGSYSYKPAEVAVKFFIKRVDAFNTNLTDNLTVCVTVRETKRESAVILLEGHRKSINTFLNKIFVETDLLQHFEVKC